MLEDFEAQRRPIFLCCKQYLILARQAYFLCAKFLQILEQLNLDKAVYIYI